ncbi:MAG: hypothetical protein GXY34_12985, partial [Syntrophomonadaceae bacterium]|nr:hypothetical protein [Syntrophomonadaceae bacterium]
LTAHLAEKATLSTYGHVKINRGSSDVVPACTTGNITLYVRTDGSDSNDGSANDAAHALLTIQAAVNKLPQIINHNANINVAAGTYAEDVMIKGFTGKGEFYLNGGTNLTTAANFTVNSISITKCDSLYMKVTGFTAIGTTVTVQSGFAATYSSGQQDFFFCICTTSSAYAGFSSGVAVTVYFQTCKVANRGVGLQHNMGMCVSDSWDAGSTGNTIGLKAMYGGQLAKNGTQPAGTTAESALYGGVIHA